MLALVLSAPAFVGPARPLAAGPARLAAGSRSAGPRLSYESAAEEEKASEALEHAKPVVKKQGHLFSPPIFNSLADSGADSLFNGKRPLENITQNFSKPPTHPAEKRVSDNFDALGNDNKTAPRLICKLILPIFS